MAKDAIGSLVSLGLIGGAAYVGGAYFGYWSMPSWLSGMLGQAAPAPASGGGASSASPNSGSGTSAEPAIVPVAWPAVTTLPAPGTLAWNIWLQLVSDANGADRLTFDGWNYYYHKRVGSFLQAQSGLDTSHDLISALQFITQLGSGPGITTPTGPGLSGLGPYVPLQGGYQNMRPILQRPPVVGDMASQQRRNYRVARWPS